jgi:tyrosyl-tRNA synthetase
LTDIFSKVGGATGAIGDPTGRSSSRTILSEEHLLHNQHSIRDQIQGLFGHFDEFAEKRGVGPEATGKGTIKIVNNLEWFGSMSFLTFLMSAGRHASVLTMMGRESVQARVQQAEGITFAELSYQLLQAYDFWELFRREKCKLQVRYFGIHPALHQLEASIADRRK